jgi:ABC-type sugar transport system permease subunit
VQRDHETVRRKDFDRFSHSENPAGGRGCADRDDDRLHPAARHPGQRGGTLDQSVTSLLGQRLPKTIVLVGISTILALIIAVPIGLLQAVRRNRPVDYTFTSLSFLFYAAPTFFVGTVLILVFSVKLGWLGPRGLRGSGCCGGTCCATR